LESEGVVKIRVTMKNPDALHEAVREAVAGDMAKLELDDDERDSIAEMREEKTREFCKRWFKWSECITIEIDTIEGTCRVVEVKS
jgi:hypothetical protein